jgi:hypothetical protein
MPDGELGETSRKALGVLQQTRLQIGKIRIKRVRIETLLGFDPELGAAPLRQQFGLAIPFAFD